MIPAKPPAPAKFLNIQALRAVAVALVIAYHMRRMTSFNLSGSYDFGQGGVDIFFVLSGFIMAWIIRTTSEADPATFASRRLVRIIPLYWLLTILLFAAAHVIPALLSTGVPTLEMLWKSLLFIPYWATDGEIQPIVYMGWTLSYEMFFYILITMVLASRLRARLVSVSLVLIGLVVSGFLLRPTNALAVVGTDPRLLEFVAGMAVCAWVSTRPPATGLRTVWRFPVAGLLGVALALIIFSDQLWPKAPFVLQWGIPATVIVACACWLERWNVRARWRWLVLIGDASYAIYLSHPFVVRVAEKAIQRLPDIPLALQIVANGVVVLLILLCGVLMHLLIEKPLLQKLHRYTRAKVTQTSRASLENPR